MQKWKVNSLFYFVSVISATCQDTDEFVCEPVGAHTHTLSVCMFVSEPPVVFHQIVKCYAIRVTQPIHNHPPDKK